MYLVYRWIWGLLTKKSSQVVVVGSFDRNAVCDEGEINADLGDDD